MLESTRMISEAMLDWESEGARPGYSSLRRSLCCESEGSMTIVSPSKLSEDDGDLYLGLHSAVVSSGIEIDKVLLILPSPALLLEPFESAMVLLAS